MFAPGYYKTNYRALRFREVARMVGLQRAFSGYLETRFKRSEAGVWMPGLWANAACRQEDLSEDFWQVTKPHRLDFARLGYTECGFLKVTRNLNPMIRDSGGITYLDPARRHFGQLLFNKFRHPSTGAEMRQIIIAFTAAFAQGNLACTNNKKRFDTPSQNEVIRIASYDVTFIHQQFLKHLQEKKEAPREFPDLESLRQWFDARQTAAFEEQARRRLFVPMSESEIAVAQARKAQADSGIFPPPRRNFKLGFWPVIIVLVIGLQFARQHIRRAGDDTLEYRGEHFKMRKAYASYEDYKDDPDNLDTNELDRIERVMTSAKIPASFADLEALSHTLIFDLKFPGYGAGGIGGPAQTDDGSELDVESVEIPQRNKERYFVVRQYHGPWILVDDFIHQTNTNMIRRVKLEKQTLRYYDDQGRLIREKPLQE